MNAVNIFELLLTFYQILLEPKYIYAGLEMSKSTENGTALRGIRVERVVEKDREADVS
jgi:hypothetical protein